MGTSVLWGHAHKTIFEDVFILSSRTATALLGTTVLTSNGPFQNDSTSDRLLTNQFELEFLRPTVSRPVRLGIGPPFGTLDQILSCSSFFFRLTNT
jgi:hypothetical protein